METFLQDLKYAVRMLVKKPGFTLVAVLSLTLGIGANTTIFTLAKAVFLQTVAAKDPLSRRQETRTIALSSLFVNQKSSLPCRPKIGAANHCAT